MRARPPAVYNRQAAPKGLHLQYGFKSQQAATADKAHSKAQGGEWDKNSNT